MHNTDSGDDGVGSPEPRPELGQLKVAINTLLWEQLPPAVTLGTAETMALSILRKIESQWDGYEDSAARKSPGSE